jgi:enamine deaminase RidA (YjgF/YER057c/UK114 family)
MQVLFERFHYAPAVRVDRMLLVSGQVGRDETTLEIPDDPEAQIERAFENLGAVLAAAGAGYRDVVELVSYHVDIRRHLRAFMRLKDRYFVADYPAWTAIGVEALAQPGLLVEIRATACLARRPGTVTPNVRLRGEGERCRWGRSRTHGTIDRPSSRPTG